MKCIVEEIFGYKFDCSGRVMKRRHNACEYHFHTIRLALITVATDEELENFHEYNTEQYNKLVNKYRNLIAEILQKKIMEDIRSLETEICIKKRIGSILEKYINENEINDNKNIKRDKELLE